MLHNSQSYLYPEPLPIFARWTHSNELSALYHSHNPATMPFIMQNNSFHQSSWISNLIFNVDDWGKDGKRKYVFILILFIHFPSLSFSCDFQARCNREKPPCKYYHPPQHLKDQLLINGRNHLALKNALMQQMGMPPNGQIITNQIQQMVSARVDNEKLH